MRRILILMALLFVAGCEMPPETGPGLPEEVLRARRSFAEVIARVEPVAERECESRTSGVNCNFMIRVDPDPKAEPNAFQAEDRGGRPVILFTAALIDSTRNADELAFVLSHETAHHILGHLDRQARYAAAGAAIFGDLAARDGASPEVVVRAEQLGAVLGARSYSKEFELEADQLGTVIAFHAGFDPLRGAEYFGRLPDPGDRFLGSHPPNATRVRVVQETVQALQASGTSG